MQKDKNRKIYRIILTIVIWSTIIVFAGLMYYSNHYMLHGLKYSTGEVVCIDDRGVCKEEYKEDLRGIDIPSWAKFFRNDSSFIFLVGLVFLGIVCHTRQK